MTDILKYINEQIAHHGAQLEKYMIALSVIKEIEKKPRTQALLAAPKVKKDQRKHEPFPEPIAPKVREFVKESTEPFTSHQIVELLKVSGRRSSVDTTLHTMLKQGQIRRIDTGKYEKIPS